MSQKIRIDVRASLICSIMMLVSPLCGMPVLLYSLLKSRKNLRRYSFAISLIYASIGYNIYCKNEPDLVRYFRAIELLQDKNWLYILHNDIEYLYTRDTLFYFVSRTGNVHILPFIVGMCTYYCVFYIFFDAVEQNNLIERRNGKVVAVLICILAVGVVPTFNVISNVRCVMALVIVSFGVYRDIIQRKRNVLTLLCYIIPIGLHIVAILLVLLRCFLPLLKRCLKLVAISVLLLPTLVKLTLDLLNKITLDNVLFNLIRILSEKAYNYVDWTSGGYADEVTSYFSYWIERAYGVPFILLMLYYAAKLLQNTELNGEQINDERKFISYYIILSMLTLGCLWIKTGAFWRLEAVCVFLAPTILLPVYNRNIYKSWLLPFLASGVLMLMLNIYLFMRWVYVINFFEGFILTSPLIIWIRALVRLI